MQLEPGQGRAGRVVVGRADLLGDGVGHGGLVAHPHAMGVRAEYRSALDEREERGDTRVLRVFDILVNNAGVLLGGPLTDITLEEFDRIIAVSLRAALLGAQARARRPAHRRMPGGRPAAGEARVPVRSRPSAVGVQVGAAGFRGVWVPSGVTRVAWPTMCSMGRSEGWSPYA